MDRFDDVEFKILEEPEPRRPRRRSPRFASFVTVTVAAGLFAASALASADEPPAAKTPSKAGKFEGRYHHGCKKGGGRHHDRGGDESLGLRY